MNKEEKSTITSNLSALLGSTKCSTLFLAIFTQHKILSPAESSTIEGLKGASGVAEFYSIIQQRKGAFKILISALKQTCQSGAADLLEQSTSSTEASCLQSNTIPDSSSPLLAVEEIPRNGTTSNTSPIHRESPDRPDLDQRHAQNGNPSFKGNKPWLYVLLYIIMAFLLCILVGNLLVYTHIVKGSFSTLAIASAQTYLNDKYNDTTIVAAPGTLTDVKISSTLTQQMADNPNVNSTFTKRLLIPTNTSRSYSSIAPVKNAITKFNKTSRVTRNEQHITAYKPQDLHAKVSEICDPNMYTTLKITIIDHKVWDNVTIDCGSRITKLEIHGSPTIFNIHSFLSSTRNLKELNINALKLYQTNLDLHFIDTMFATLKLPFLEKLSISGPKRHEQSNWEILCLISRHFWFRKLTQVFIDGPSISVRTGTELSRLISKNIKTLKEICFENLFFVEETLNLNLNSAFLNQFEFSVVNGSNANLAQQSILKIMSTARKINNFRTNVSMNNQFSPLLALFMKKNVKTANFTLNVSQRNSNVDLSVMSKVSEYLTELEINLIGEDPTMKIAVDGIDKISYHTKNITIESNCNIFPRDGRCRSVQISKRKLIFFDPTC